MSKLGRTFLLFSFTFALILQVFNNAAAQTLEIKLRVSTPVAEVEGKFLDLNTSRNLSFLNSYTNIENLGGRISDLILTDRNGQQVKYKKLVDGEYLAESDFQNWNYKVNLSVPQNPSAMAHISWAGDEQGILMLGDLVPEFGEKTFAKTTLELPIDWKITTVEKRLGGNVFEVSDVEKSIFYIGKNWREREIAIGGTKLNLTMSGDWQVSDAEAVQMAHDIFAAYENLYGLQPLEKVQIFLGKFPREVKTGRWEAETRGGSVTIFSSELDFKTQSVQRLHEQLRHEIFHLWLPNGVNLSGNYDWFYEGFALYESLKTALAMNQIRFDDFLDTLGRAFSIDTLQSRRTSLIEASKNRWNGSNTQVYARGMLVAFLIDIALLQKSKGKIALAEMLRGIYQKHRFPSAKQDANTVILNILQSRGELQTIVAKYIKGAEDITWQTDLDIIGIESATGNFSTQLKVKAKLDSRQKDFLDKLGYNNWRKKPRSLK